MTMRLVNFFWRRRRHRFGVSLGAVAGSTRVTSDGTIRVTTDAETRVIA